MVPETVVDIIFHDIDKSQNIFVGYHYTREYVEQSLEFADSLTFEQAEACPDEKLRNVMVIYKRIMHADRQAGMYVKALEATAADLERIFNNPGRYSVVMVRELIYGYMHSLMTFNEMNTEQRDALAHYMLYASQAEYRQ